MRAPATEGTGTSGQSYIKAVLEEMGWAVVANPEHDLGTDLWVNPRDARRVDLGLMLGLQVKNGESWFSEPGEEAGESGWWHRNDRAHFDYWTHHVVPHLLVLRDPLSQSSYWVHVSPASVVWTGVQGKAFVPEHQRLDAVSLPSLIDIAATSRPVRRWSGSAWTGVGDLAPAEALRYAMLAPRLVAPHPNAEVRTVGAPEAIALMAAGRFSELARYGVGSDDSSRTGWDWTLATSLLDYLHSGDLDALRGCATAAVEAHEQAAGAVVLCAALVECGAIEEALEALKRPLDADRCGPADHAWLQVHRARCLAELGDWTSAVELAVSVQSLPQSLPEDVTAAAISGSGAALVFRTSDLFKGDVAATISAGDTETSWWRAQSVSWGLNSLFKESFRDWTRNENEMRFMNADPADRLRGVTLVDGFTALQDGWCHTKSLLAKWHLMSRNLSRDEAVGCLTDLRRAGDRSAMAAAVAHLLESGPASAVRDAADLVDLDGATHTESNASLELLIRGADVLSVSTADTAAAWAMQEADGLAAWTSRVRGSFNVEDRRADLLHALLPVASRATQIQIRAFLVHLPPLPDQGRAHAWARVVHAVPVGEWTPSEVQSLLRRTGDNWEFSDAVRAVGIRRDPASRAANEEALRAGGLSALQWVGPITEVPEDAVPSLVTSLSGAIRSRIAEMRRGMFGMYAGVEPGRVLVLLNSIFPSDADWEPIVELLSEPRAAGSLLDETIRSLEANAAAVDELERDRLLEALTAVLQRAPQHHFPLGGSDPRPAARAAIEALTQTPVPAAQWLSARDTRGRQAMIFSLARRANPSDATALAALATDPDPRTRAIVAAALSYWLVTGVSVESISETLAALLTEDATLAARRAVAEWPDRPDERLRTLAEPLLDHLSAKVRAAAVRVLDME